ncbi:MAG: hypothetical protein AAF752_01230, partial [Bacteroidota bacterium]
TALMLVMTFSANVYRATYMSQQQIYENELQTSVTGVGLALMETIGDVAFDGALEATHPRFDAALDLSALTLTALKDEMTPAEDFGPTRGGVTCTFPLPEAVGGSMAMPLGINACSAIEDFDNVKRIIRLGDDDRNEYEVEVQVYYVDIDASINALERLAADKTSLRKEVEITIRNRNLYNQNADSGDMKEAVVARLKRVFAFRPA